MRLTPEIVTAIQQLALEQRGMLGSRAQWHVGDLAWNLSPFLGHDLDIRLWTDDARLVAWSWLQHDDRARLEYDVHPHRPHLLDELLAANAGARMAFAFADDGERRTALARHGLTEPGDQMHYLERDVPEPAELPPLSAGFRYRTAGDGDLAERVAIHRDVWAPSRLTEPAYAQVRAQWPYRDSLDCVIEAPDGRFAAYCLCWPDAEHGVGEFEPVGVRAEFRRRGLGAAVCTFALRRLSEEGCRQVIVYCDTLPACALYESLGFRIHASLVGYSKP
jgi:ribosomal protein S18 acetylase RimI-like enzyme